MNIRDLSPTERDILKRAFHAPIPVQSYDAKGALAENLAMSRLLGAGLLAEVADPHRMVITPKGAGLAGRLLDADQVPVGLLPDHRIALAAAYTTDLLRDGPRKPARARTVLALMALGLLDAQAEPKRWVITAKGRAVHEALEGDPERFGYLPLTDAQKLAVVEEVNRKPEPEAPPPEPGIREIWADAMEAQREAVMWKRVLFWTILPFAVTGALLWGCVLLIWGVVKALAKWVWKTFGEAAPYMVTAGGVVGLARIAGGEDIGRWDGFFTWASVALVALGVVRFARTFRDRKMDVTVKVGR